MHCDLTADVLVIGAGASGWPAAIGAAREGASVLLIDDDALPGGQAVDSFVAMPDGGPPRSGVTAEFLHELETHHALTDRKVDRNWDFWYRPADMASCVQKLLAAEPKIQYLGRTRAVRLLFDGTRAEGAEVRGIDGKTQYLHAQVVLDCTGSGALAEAAGLEVRYGEDSRADFGEEFAPETRSDFTQLCTWMYISRRVRPDPENWAPRQTETGYVLESGTGWRNAASPRGSEAETFLHWGCRLACPDLRLTDARAELERRARILMEPDWEELRAHGFDILLSPRIGVREERRVIGDAVVTGVDLVRGNVPDDSILTVDRGIDLWKRSAGESVRYPRVKPYGIPYRALLPRGADSLLLAGKHMSGSHLAMASYRVQCILGQVGQAAGAAAGLAVRLGVAPRRLAFGDLEKCLLSPRQHLAVHAFRDL